jgi:hypothetical protein
MKDAMAMGEDGAPLLEQQIDRAMEERKSHASCI